MTDKDRAYRCEIADTYHFGGSGHRRVYAEDGALLGEGSNVITVVVDKPQTLRIVSLKEDEPHVD